MEEEAVLAPSKFTTMLREKGFAQEESTLSAGEPGSWSGLQGVPGIPRAQFCSGGLLPLGLT